MDLKQYMPLALRTNAPGDKAQDRFKRSDIEGLIKILQTISENSEKLDVIKKAIFYGKNHKDGQNYEYVYVNEEFIQLFHAIIGIQTESAELIDALLKTMVDGQHLDKVNILEELGDIEWYKNLAYSTLDVKDPGAILQKNIEKLRRRYPEKFTENDAINRNLEAERKILEQ